MKKKLKTNELLAEIAPVLAAASALDIKSLDDAEVASRLRAAIKQHQNTIKSFFAPHKKRADEVHAALCADEKKALESDNAAVALIDQKITDYRSTLDLIGGENQKIQGLSFRSNWKAVVEDRAALIKAAAKDNRFIDFVMPDESELRDFAISTKGNIKVPGVRFYCENKPVGRN